MLKNIIYQRLYDTRRGFNGKGIPYINSVRTGMLLARKVDDGTIEFGFSSVNVQANDKYDDRTAIQIATTGTSANPPLDEMPTRVRRKFKAFVQRARKYFKDGTVKVTG